MEFHQPGEPRRQAKRNCSSHSNPLSCLFRTRGTNYFGKRGKSVQAPLTYKSPGTTWIDGMTGLEPSNWRVISRRNSDTGGPVTPLNITNTIWSALTASATDTGASRKHKKTPKNKKKKKTGKDSIEKHQVEKWGMSTWHEREHGTVLASMFTNRTICRSFPRASRNSIKCRPNIYQH